MAATFPALLLAILVCGSAAETLDSVFNTGLRDVASFIENNVDKYGQVYVDLVTGIQAKMDGGKASNVGYYAVPTIYKGLIDGAAYLLADISSLIQKGITFLLDFLNNNLYDAMQEVFDAVMGDANPTSEAISCQQNASKIFSESVSSLLANLNFTLTSPERQDNAAKIQKTFNLKMDEMITDGEGLSEDLKSSSFVGDFIKFVATGAVLFGELLAMIASDVGGLINGFLIALGQFITDCGKIAKIYFDCVDSIPDK